MVRVQETGDRSQEIGERNTTGTCAVAIVFEMRMWK